jgi:hypothetical protein
MMYLRLETSIMHVGLELLHFVLKTLQFKLGVAFCGEGRCRAAHGVEDGEFEQLEFWVFVGRGVEGPAGCVQGFLFQVVGALNHWRLLISDETSHLLVLLYHKKLINLLKREISQKTSSYRIISHMKIYYFVIELLVLIQSSIIKGKYLYI